ncbi:hypothetical protein GCM10010359_50170 [Streptomyces morookaense]|nr:hypothetical protein GCM10010359_50170 [Streptomyces morookaense]
MYAYNTSAEDHSELVYQCRLSLSTRTLTFLTGLLGAHLKKIRSRWRKLPAGRIAVIVLAALRHDQRLADLARGNQVSRTTVDRWLKGMIELLAARAPRLERVLAKIAREGGSVVLLDGSLIPTQRRTGLPMKRRWSTKHKRHGLLVIALTDIKGRLLWTSTARPARFGDHRLPPRRPGQPAPQGGPRGDRRPRLRRPGRRNRRPGGHHRLQEAQGQEAPVREEAGQPADRGGTGSV